ncbi:MAG: hypothetical protein KDD94_08565, partial [Calditrichaeota bacterium]|nr:hypothetical protein [Calditrichota bacterium]
MIRFYLLLFFIQLLVAQQLNEYSLRNLTVRNGISQNSINVILQDSKGFLWLGTRAGLNRYNAYNFEEFKHIPFDSNSLVDSHINEIFEDQNGRIWLGTSGGLDLFDFAKRQFIHIKTEIDSANSRRRIIHTINEDMNGNLWIGTSAGLLVMNSDRQIRTFYKENGDLAILSSAVVTDLSIQSDILWIGTLNGLFQMNLTSAEIK